MQDAFQTKHKEFTPRNCYVLSKELTQQRRDVEEKVDSIFELDKVTHTKQAVYIDDNIVLDHDVEPDVIMQMKAIIKKTFE